MELKGSLSGSRVLDIIQTLPLIGHCGWLEILDSRGLKADIAFCQSRICHARCGHLLGEEALLACFFWYEGEFAFRAAKPESITCEGVGALPATFNLSSFALNAVYLADELEKRRVLVPGDHNPISLEKSFEGEDPFGCNLQQVYEALTKTSPVTPEDLDARLSLAPLKIRLALAYLAEKGVISRPEVPRGSPSFGRLRRAWLEVAARFGGGVRVLVVVPDNLDKEDACSMLAEAMQKKLKTPDPWISLSPSGPCFLRFKPEPSGVLTLCLMSAGELQGLPEYMAFAAGYDVIACTGDALVCCQEERRSMVSTPVIDVPDIQALATHFFQLLAGVGKNSP